MHVAKIRCYGDMLTEIADEIDKRLGSAAVQTFDHFHDLESVSNHVTEWTVHTTKHGGGPNTLQVSNGYLGQRRKHSYTHNLSRQDGANCQLTHFDWNQKCAVACMKRYVCVTG
jgi:hypothetical protein